MSSITAQIIFGVPERARYRHCEYLYDSVPMNTVVVVVRGEGTAPEIPAIKSVIIN